MFTNSLLHFLARPSLRICKKENDRSDLLPCIPSASKKLKSRSTCACRKHVWNLAYFKIPRPIHRAPNEFKTGFYEKVEEKREGKIFPSPELNSSTMLYIWKAGSSFIFKDTTPDAASVADISMSLCATFLTQTR